MLFMKIEPAIFGSEQVATTAILFEILQLKTGLPITMSILLLKIRQANYGLLQRAIPSCMMEKHFSFSPMTVNHLQMFVLLLKIRQAIFGSEDLRAFGGMTEEHLPILRKSLLVISLKIKMAISGPVQKALRARLGLLQKRVISKPGHFRGMTEILCLVKSQQ